MCRVAAYLGGPEVSLASLVLEPEHSLVEQAHSPREMLSGTVNTDGFGVGWYVPEGPGSAVQPHGAPEVEPALYRSGRSIWADTSFASLASKLASRSIFAAVRNATPGLPVEDSGVPPFGTGPYLCMHNGAIEGFRHTAMRELRSSLSDAAYANLLGVTDSETIFADLCDRLGVSSPGETFETPDSGTLTEALAETIRRVSAVAERAGVQATLNLSVTDGSAMVFSRYSLRGPGNSLYYLEDGRAFPGGLAVASERLDGDPDWREVPDDHLLVADATGARLEPLR